MSYVVHCKRSRYDVYVGRPSPWGNPYSHKEGTLAAYKTASIEESIIKFEEYVRSSPALITLIKDQLKGKILGCWCHPTPCHADILAKIANE